jgi:hypothetical protein
MKLQTEIKLEQQEQQIDYTSKVVLLGSCFAENIGNKFTYYKFQTLQNPFGILFHPKAIETLIINAVEGKQYSEDAVFLNNEQWHCYDAHSKLSTTSKEALLNTLNEGLKKTRKHLTQASHVIITLGTAWVYDVIETNTTVANCHKVPQKQFSKKLLSISSIFKSLQNIFHTIQSVNKKATIVFTVSPVRHIKDGFVENTQSKSHLISAIHEFLNWQSITENQESFYFPSYEIMLDELRDYRFYKTDMLHPNDLAVDYIWEKFNGVWITSEAQKTMDAVDAIQKGLAHKPFNKTSQAHVKFLEKLQLKKEVLQTRFPHMLF